MTLSTHSCHCGQRAVGLTTNMIEKRYYCNRHWYVISGVIDKWLNDQYQKQWGDKDWFNEAASPKRSTGKKFKMV